MEHTKSDKERVVENIEKNSGLDLRNYYKWLKIKAELEAAGINTGPKEPEPQKKSRLQPVLLDALGI